MGVSRRDERHQHERNQREDERSERGKSPSHLGRSNFCGGMAVPFGETACNPHAVLGTSIPLRLKVTTMRIAHVSDLHVLSPAGVRWRSVVFNKRLTGYANILLRRGRVFRRDYLDTVLAAARHDADHVVVTGDITNLSLDTEYQVARG